MPHDWCRYPHDRAAVVATALVGLVVRAIYDPITAHAEITAILREEFYDIERQTLNETRV